ncbi:MAG: hypothetical protein MJ138_02420 [Kiritimatiellae bacterium]|nr:hypothetical protein [Kiritimatiellia bacterium]
MKRPLVLLLWSFSACCSIAAAEAPGGEWRVSVGASVIGGIRPRMNSNGAEMFSASGFGRLAEGRSKADAYAEGSGAAHDGVRKFDGDAWFNPVDSGSANDPGYSWNWRLHDPTGPDPDGRVGFTERTAYSEPTAASAAGGCGDDSSKWMPGLRVELAREFFRDGGARPWGVDAAAAFAYYFQRGLWKASGTAARAGYYEWWNDSGDTAQYVIENERGTQYHDGMWGAGTYDGPGAELATSAWKVRDVATPSGDGSSAHALRYRGDGDYREYSIELLARPWWEPYDWFRVFASVGVEVSRREFEWTMHVAGTDGSTCSERGDAREWRALGLLGGGLSLRWRDWTLAGEALWRFGGDDLDVSGRTVNGRIGHGDWGFRVAIGHEF